MIVEVRKNVCVNPAFVVSVFFDPAQGNLVIQTTIHHHSFKLEEGEMPDASVARVVKLLNDGMKPARSPRVTNNVTVTGEVKPVVPNPQNLAR